MQFSEEEILEVPETTWSGMMGLDILPNATFPESSGEENILIGQVSISGGWDGQVRLHATAALGRATSAKMFQIEPDIVQAQDQIDAIYELTNIITGNIKSLLPEPC
jgi:chemotaxis protein CheX